LSRDEMTRDEMPVHRSGGLIIHNGSHTCVSVLTPGTAENGVMAWNFTPSLSKRRRRCLSITVS